MPANNISSDISSLIDIVLGYVFGVLDKVNQAQISILMVHISLLG